MVQRLGNGMQSLSSPCNWFKSSPVSYFLQEKLARDKYIRKIKHEAETSAAGLTIHELVLYIMGLVQVIQARAESLSKHIYETRK